MMTMKELEKAVAEYRSLKAMKEELETELKEAEKQIITYMNEQQKTKETGVDFKISYSDCSRKSLDAKKLEAAFGNLDGFRSVTNYKRLTVS